MAAPGLFGLLSQRIDPLQATASGMNMYLQGEQQNEQKRRNLETESQGRTQLAETSRSDQAREGLAQQGIDLQGQQQNWGQTKDKVQGLNQYVSLLHQGDFEGAAQFAASLKALGVDLKPSGQVQAPGVHEFTPQAGPDRSKALQDRALGNQIDTAAADIITSIGGKAPEGKPLSVPDAPVPGSRFQASPPQAQASSTGPLPVADVYFDGVHMGSIDPNKRVEQEKNYAAAEGKAFTNSLPFRYRGWAAGVEGAPDRASVKARIGDSKDLVLQALKNEAAVAMAGAKAAQAGTPGISSVRDDTEAIISHVENRYQVPELHKRARAAEDVMRLLQSGNPMAERQAFTANLKSMFSSVTSDSELKFAREGAGKLNEIAMKFNSWFEGGKLPDDYVNLLSQANDLVQKGTRRALIDVAGIAANGIRKTPTLALTPEARNQEAQVAIGRITGDYEGIPDWNGTSQVVQGGGAGSRVQQSTKGLDPQTGQPMQRLPNGKEIPDSTLHSEERNGRPGFMK